MKQTNQKNSEKFKENSERSEGGKDCNFRVIRIIFIRKVYPKVTKKVYPKS